MRHLSSILFACLSLPILSFCGQKSENKDQALPNVLFIAIDDLRPELGCYGDTQVKSPNIDKLASQGMVFNRAYCNVPVCGASRASMLTGIRPTKDRFVSFNTLADEDVPGVKSLPQVFKEAGYTTISNGKIAHHKEDMQERSWSEPAWQAVSHMTSHDPETTKNLTERGRGLIYEYPDVPDSVYPDAMVAEKTIKDLRRLKQNGKPFFLACGFIRPHMPFYAPKKYWDLYNRDDIEMAENRFPPEDSPESLKGSGEFNSYHLGAFDPGTDAWHKMMRHGYFACTSFADKLAGDVLNELDQLGLADNTIVVIWGDHGWHLGEHDFWGKHNTMHNALRVPLIIKVPGQGTGVKTESLVENIDIYPTLCELAGIPVPASVHGRSFKSLLKSPERSFRESIYSRFKKADALVTKEMAYSLYENGEEMLYDRVKDPQENKNVAGNPDYAEALTEMRAKLIKEIEVSAQIVLD